MGAHQRLQQSVLSYPDQGLTAGLASPSNEQLEVHSALAFNGTAAENAIGLFQSINSSHSKCFQLLAAADVEITAALIAETSTSIFSTVNNDGVLFQSKDKFHYVAFNISQAQAGSPVFTYKYYNGSTYSTLTLLNTPSYSATGIQVLVFNAPVDWAAGDGAEDGDSSLYSIQVIATTSPSQAIKINSLKLGKMLAFSDSVLPSAALDVDFGNEPYLLQTGESILPFFSYTNSSNRLETAYKVSP